MGIINLQIDKKDQFDNAVILMDLVNGSIETKRRNYAGSVLLLEPHVHYDLRLLYLKSL